MAEHKIRIIPQRREIDAARLAEALLDLVDHLSPDDRARFIADGKRSLSKAKHRAKPKGSAA